MRKFCEHGHSAKLVESSGANVHEHGTTYVKSGSNCQAQVWEHGRSTSKSCRVVRRNIRDHGHSTSTACGARHAQTLGVQAQHVKSVSTCKAQKVRSIGTARQKRAELSDAKQCGMRFERPSDCQKLKKKYRGRIPLRKLWRQATYDNFDTKTTYDKFDIERPATSSTSNDLQQIDDGKNSANGANL